VNQSAAVAAWIVGMGGAVLLLGKLATVLWRAFRRFGWFLDAALGEPAQGNTAAKPGFADRLGAIEGQLTDLSPARLTGIEERQAAIEQRLTAIDVIEQRLGAIEALLQQEAARFPDATAAVGS